MHSEDLALVTEGVLDLVDLVTIRAGEPAHDQSKGRVVPASHEFLKLVGAAGSWCCRFYDRTERACTIHRRRPLECRLLFCRDTGPLEEVIGRDLIIRNNLLESDDPVLEILHRQEEEIPYTAVAELLAGLDRGDDPGSLLARLNAIVRADLELRRLFLHHHPDRERQELFLLGRPLFLVLAPYGFRICESRTGISLHLANGYK